MDTSFQLGLELTNVLTPVTSAVTALGSLAVARAIKQAGSDALTEIELASFLGRNRIDSSLQYHFRQIVGKSSQTVLSRYLDIVLDVGAGPTVQNALHNPELLSMVIQLSFLCSVHEESSLAQGVVEAIERNLRQLKADLGKVPHYPSLCGTLRVCKQETNNFQWSHLFDSVERKIEASFGERAEQNRRKNQLGKSENGVDILDRKSIVERMLPFPVLQVLLLSLHSLQHFPEERLLNIECASGVTTIVIWCYHVLGLNVKLTLMGKEIAFGGPIANVFIRESDSDESKASLLHPKSIHEPLFHLMSTEGDPRIGPDHRRSARGYAHQVIKRLSTSPATFESYSNWVIHQGLRIIQSRAEAAHQTSPLQSSQIMQTGFAMCSTHELFGFTQETITRTACFLFDSEHISMQNISVDTDRLPPPHRHLIELSSLVLLLLSLARVQADDLDSCGNIPLSTQAQQQFRQDPCLRAITSGNLQAVDIGLTRAFDVLACFLQGPEYSENSNDESVLVSACGWSLYFNSVSCEDPAEYFDSPLRIVQGVPTRGQLRKTRIVDGPTELYFSYSEGVTLENQWEADVSFFPGVSIARRGRVFGGYQEPDAFQITQEFEWKYNSATPTKHLLGLREMLNLCVRFSFFLPCHCIEAPPSFQEMAKKYIRHEDLQEDSAVQEGGDVHRTLFGFQGSVLHTFSDLDESLSLPDEEQPFEECVFAAQAKVDGKATSEAWLFCVSDKPAARWMQLSDMYPTLVEDCDKSYRLLLRGHETCLRCAFEAAISNHIQPYANDFTKDSEETVVYALL